MIIKKSHDEYEMDMISVIVVLSCTSIYLVSSGKFTNGYVVRSPRKVDDVDQQQRKIKLYKCYECEDPFHIKDDCNTGGYVCMYCETEWCTNCQVPYCKSFLESKSVGPHDAMESIDDDK